jgi:hypothetical protein
MSLKKFHIVFITLATLCMAGFSLWCFLPRQGGGVGVLVSGGVSLGLAFVTAFYGVWFYRNKLSDVAELAAASASK